jgi:hypothetical protein
MMIICVWIINKALMSKVAWLKKQYKIIMILIMSCDFQSALGGWEYKKKIAVAIKMYFDSVIKRLF